MRVTTTTLLSTLLGLALATTTLHKVSKANLDLNLILGTNELGTDRRRLVAK